MKTLCIYALHEYNLNVDFFIQNGLFKDPEVDFYFVINDPNLKLDIPNAKVINRENINYDFGAWSHVLFTKEDSSYLYERYDYFIFLNSTVRGPFLPVWHKDKNWIRLFTERLTHELKLFGTMICFFDHKPHVQSMVLATDKVGLQLGITHKIFMENELPQNKASICLNKEIRYSTVMLSNGYNIGCMLKAYDGIDFREPRPKVNTVCFFAPYSYFGTNVHPYETIFSKVVGDDRQAGHNQQIVDLFTNWQYSNPEIKNEPFNWVKYLLSRPQLLTGKIGTRELALQHYHASGLPEGPDYYRIDLNPLGTSGLLNQFWSLVNGILIGHYVGRSILVEHFYPDYDQRVRIPIRDIVDIHSLNCLIAKLGLNTHVSAKLDGITWKPSKYINPTKLVFNRNGFIGTLSLLRSETEKYVDIADTFTDSMFKQNSDPYIQQLFIDLITGIKFTHQVEQIVCSVKQELNLKDDYSVIHLRLEDDILKHRPVRNLSEEAYGNMVYKQYQDHIPKYISPEDQIYVCTYLTKTNHKFNHVIGELKTKYPYMKVATTWRSRYPDFYKGRDIDALIDYLVSIDGKVFIGYAFSTFSQAIKYAYDKARKKAILLS